MKIEILDEAEQDLINGFYFYQRQQEGLGYYFLDSLFSDLESLNIYAGVHPLHYRFHRLLAKRFPFAVYYLIEGDRIPDLRCFRLPAGPGMDQEPPGMTRKKIKSCLTHKTR